ncbi:protein kinase C delta type-like [Rana temporaria]|uniref:protein kinase C delta type-like n=1 Tax=Rana temporaria TaxID=8407 RepID=UPI001AAC6B77|nr:protein kinase C delta type-like [Rana temporaria]
MAHKREPIVENPDRVLNERIAMEIAGGNLFCAHAYATFQTENYLFYVMEYMRGGDLNDIDEVLGITDDNYTMDIATVKLVAAELVCGLQYLHSRGIVHRDMKTENVLVDSAGHVHIADFGLAALNVFGDNLVTEYFGHMYNGAPEMLFEMPYDGAVDYFALGVLLFRFALGRLPFENICTSSEGIMYGQPCFPDDPAPDPVLKDLLEKLLIKFPFKRKNFIANIQDHPFFNGINWKELEAGEAPPPISIRRKGFRDFTRKKLKPEDLMNNINSDGDPIEPSISAEEQKMFDGFSFVSDEWKAMQKLK